MNFTGLEYFLAVAEDGNLTRTAEKMHITQQALSSQMSKLEAELGVVLFERNPSFALTYAGERLRELSREILDLRRRIYQECGDIKNGEKGRLNIGISYTCGRAVLPKVLPEFVRKHPFVEIDLREGNSSELEALLERGDIDFMIAFDPIRVKGIEVHKLSEESLILVVPKSITRERMGERYDELYPQNLMQADINLFRNVPFIMLKRGNLSRAMLDDYMRMSNFEPQVIMETENSETALALAEAGMGATVFSDLFMNNIHPGLNDPENRNTDHFPLNTDDTRSRLVIARLEGSYHPYLADAFLEHCMRLMDT